MRNNITAEQVRSAVLYDPETGHFVWRDRRPEDFRSRQAYGAWKATRKLGVLGLECPIGYLRITIGNRSYLAHRLAWLYVYGKWPTHTIDHINHIRSDNRIANLRDVPNAENHKNLRRGKANKTGVTGVRYLQKYGTWNAFIWQNGKRLGLGNFPDIDSAAAARKSAEKHLAYHPNHGAA